MKIKQALVRWKQKASEAHNNMLLNMNLRVKADRRNSRIIANFNNNRRCILVRVCIFKAGFRIRIRIRRIRMFLTCPDPDPDPHKFADPDPDPGKKVRK